MSVITTPLKSPTEATDRGLALSQASPPSPSIVRKRISSAALLGNDREIEIEHAGQLYRLRLTSLGKLILTK